MMQHCWAKMIIEELVRLGVDTAVVASGYRCAPLALEAMSHKKIHCLHHFDERSAGFYALGYARATGKPAVVITTSGTAVANLYPAVIEASLDNVPLIVLSSDRPVELLGCGANQAIDQIRLFGSYVRHFVDMPVPDEQTKPAYVLNAIDESYRYAVARVAPGPVHINCHWREPLDPHAEDKMLWQNILKEQERLQMWWDSNKPWLVHESCSLRQVHIPQPIAAHLKKIVKGLIVVGGGLSAAERRSVIALARHLQWPVWADVASGLRSKEYADMVIAHADMLMDASFVKGCEGVLQFGAHLVSKKLLTWLQQAPLLMYAFVSEDIKQQDPLHRLTDMIQAPVQLCCGALTKELAPQPLSVAWLAQWQKTSALVAEAVCVHVDKYRYFENEAVVAYRLSEWVGLDEALFVSNSMPVRDLEAYMSPRASLVVPVGCNRGASGIDGVLSSAIGYACGHRRRVTLLIGDLALLHDMGALALLAKAPYSVCVVVVNNGGGGIFSFLPIKNHVGEELFEKAFGTPHGWDAQNLAAAFQLAYAAPEHMADFKKIYDGMREEQLSGIIEIRTDRDTNVKLHRELQENVKEILK